MLTVRGAGCDIFAGLRSVAVTYRLQQSDGADEAAPSNCADVECTCQSVRVAPVRHCRSASRDRPNKKEQQARAGEGDGIKAEPKRGGFVAGASGTQGIGQRKSVDDRMEQNR